MTEDEPPTVSSIARGRRSNRWRQVLLFTAALLGGTLAGAGGLSYAAMVSGSVDWHRGHHLETLQRHLRAALDGVGASAVQEDKLHDILANGFMSLADDRTAHDALRKRMIDLLRAPTIDRAAVETLRSDAVVGFEARSKAITGMLLDAAGQLTPEQRSALAGKAEAMMARGRGGWHAEGDQRGDGPDGGERHGGGHQGPHGEHGPGDARAPDGDPG